MLDHALTGEEERREGNKIRKGIDHNNNYHYCIHTVDGILP
jgi:hypothetical protein